MPRHKEHGISRFNVSSNLLNSHKFIAFHKELQKLEPNIPEESALGILVAFWCFVANNRAMNGSIDGIDPYIIAKQSRWTGDNRNPDNLIQILKKVGLVEQNGQVHDWFDHQPLAKEVLRGRRRREETE